MMRKEILYGGDYNPEQWLKEPEILEKDIAYMKEAKINTVSMGMFSWSVLEPEEGNYQMSWLEERIELLYKNGIYTDSFYPVRRTTSLAGTKLSRGSEGA